MARQIVGCLMDEVKEDPLWYSGVWDIRRKDVPLPAQVSGNFRGELEEQATMYLAYLKVAWINWHSKRNPSLQCKGSIGSLILFRFEFGLDPQLVEGFDQYADVVAQQFQPAPRSPGPPPAWRATGPPNLAFTDENVDSTLLRLW